MKSQVFESTNRSVHSLIQSAPSGTESPCLRLWNHTVGKAAIHSHTHTSRALYVDVFSIYMASAVLIFQGTVAAERNEGLCPTSAGLFFGL